MKVKLKHRELAASKLMKQQETPLEPIDLTKVKHPGFMTRAYRNNRYTVMISDNFPTTAGPAIRVMIQNHTDTPIHRHWSEIQRIKNEIFGPETIAIEYFPKASELTDMHNIYWIWIYPEGVFPLPILTP